MKRRNFTAEQLFDKFRGMIKQKVFQTFVLSGIEYDEIDAQANLIFCECYLNYDRDKGSFSNYLYSNLFFKLNLFVRKYKQKLELVSLSELEDYFYTENSFIDFMISLPPSCRIIIDTLIDQPEKLLPFCSTHRKKITKNNIKKYLRSQGWVIPKIDNSFKQIQLSLKEEI